LEVSRPFLRNRSTESKVSGSFVFYAPFAHDILGARRLLLVLLASVAVAGAVVLIWPKEREPVYQGKTLSQWLELHNGGVITWAGEVQVREAGKALRCIGSNGVPFLLRWAEYQPPAWKKKFSGIIRRLPVDLNFKDWKAERAALAWLALGDLGPQARSAIPELTRLMNDTNVVFDYQEPVYTLGHLGEEALKPLLAVLSNPRHQYCTAAALVIATMKGLGTNRVQAVPILIRHLNDKDNAVATVAARALGRLGYEPALAVPALTSYLNDSRPSVRVAAVRSLGLFHKEARGAVSDLVHVLTDSEVGVREAATNALMEIAPDVYGTPPLKFPGSEWPW
jgi:hypothetical protein